MTVRTLAAGLLFLTLGTALAQPPKPAGAVRAPAPAAPPEKIDIPKRLSARVELEKGFEGKFRDAVKTFADKYELPVVLTHAVVQGNSEGDGTPRGEQEIKLPKLANVKIETVLASLCEQAQCKFLVYPDHIKIVPDTHAAYESGVLTVNADPTAGMDEVPLLSQADLMRTKPLTKRALVSATFKSRALEDVLEEIAEATGANVALSPLLPANVRQAPVTVRFANAPVDAVVRTLCEMTETGVIEDANVILVTTRERAAARAKDEAQKLKDKQPAPQFFNGPGAFAPPADPGAEIAKLKEQNEQLLKQLAVLAKQVEELQKANKKP